MKLSIIILFTFDSEVIYVKNLIKWLIKSDIPFSFEIIVVSNSNLNKFNELKNLFSKEKNVKFLYNKKNLGYGQGNHQGILKSNGEYFLILNPDVELFKGNLDFMINHMENNKDIGVLAPELIYEDGTIQDVYRRFPTIIDFVIKRSFLKNLPYFKRRLHKYLMYDRNPALINEVDWVVGALILVRRSMYDDVGGFDKRFFLFLEDTDLCRQMWQKGYKVVYFPEAKATHYNKRLSAGGVLDIFKNKMVRIHIYSALKYFWKYKFKERPHISPRFDKNFKSD